MDNINKQKSYKWYLQFDEIAGLITYGEPCPSYVTEENKEVWRGIKYTECYKHYGMPKNGFLNFD